MDDLIAKIRAAIDEDERRAKLALGVIGGRWDSWEVVAQQLHACCDTVPGIGRAGQHLHHNADPARVLRQVAAHRKILEIHKRYPNPHNKNESACSTCDEARHETWFSDDQGCPTVLALAEGYGIGPPRG